MKLLSPLKKKAVIFIGLIMLAVVLLSGRIPPAIETFKTGYAFDQMEKQMYKTFSVLDNHFQFMLPEAWHTWNETFSGGEIIYHLYFEAPDKKILGFIQVWKIDKPLKKFIEESKNAAVGTIDFKSYQVKEIMSHGKPGYLIEYTRGNDKQEYYKAYEGFIEGNDKKIYRASFFVKESNWKDYYNILFNRIIQSFQIK